MNEELKKLYGEILKIQTNVCFWGTTNGDARFYDIKVFSGDEGGFWIEVYKNADEDWAGQFYGDENQVLKWVEGGHCCSEDPDELISQEQAIEYALDL